MSGFTGCGILLMGEAEVKAFLTHPAVDRQLAPSTLGQALAALLFLYREVVGRPLAGVGPVPRARAPVRLPVVLTPEEVPGARADAGHDSPGGVALVWERDAAVGVPDLTGQGH